MTEPGRSTMDHHELSRTQVVPVPVDEAFAFYSDPQNLEAITPAWLRFAIVDAPETLSRGARLRYRLRLGGVGVSWLTEITEWIPPRGFVDTQLRGPYLEWVHAHRLTAVPEGTEIHDSVRYRVPGGPLEPLVHAAVRRALEAIFDHRARRTAELLRPNG